MRVSPLTSPMTWAGAEALTTRSSSSTTAGAGTEHAEHGGDARGDRGLGERRHGVQLPLGEAPGEHDPGAEHGTEQGEERRLRRGVHSVDRTHPDAGCSPS